MLNQKEIQGSRKIRILMLSDGSSVHTKKWINALLQKDFIIHLFSLTSLDEKDYIKKAGDNFFFTEFPLNIKKSGKADLLKLKYLRALPALKRTVCAFKPDILHAHFASSYGLLGALIGFHPYIVSVWGYDVFTFPEKSFVHRLMLKYNLSRADKVLSTSQVMKKRTENYTEKEIIVTPFGVDLSIFIEKKNISKTKLTPFSDSDIVIGTVKLLEKKYGIDYLIRAFKLLRNKYPNMQLKLLIVGDGSAKKELINLCHALRLDEYVYFTGMVNHQHIPDYINLIDIYAALSIYDSESFGVAVVEAAACSKPVVVSDAGGLPEVVENNISGFVVPRKDEVSAAEAIEKLLTNPALINTMGQAGRERVQRLYDWKKNVEQMAEIYDNILL